MLRIAFGPFFLSDLWASWAVSGASWDHLGGLGASGGVLEPSVDDVAWVTSEFPAFSDPLTVSDPLKGTSVAPSRPSRPAPFQPESHRCSRLATPAAAPAPTPAPNPVAVPSVDAGVPVPSVNAATDERGGGGSHLHCRPKKCVWSEFARSIWPLRRVQPHPASVVYVLPPICGNPRLYVIHTLL